MSTQLGSLRQLGQSLWYDNIRRGLIDSGAFAQLIRDGIVGCTSNPAIFAAAIGKSQDYDSAIKQLLAAGIREPKSLYERLAIEDIQRVADLLRPVFESTQGMDGYVSLEVSPHLAHDTKGTIEEALRLRGAVDRPNVMIKVPATPAGVPAIAALIAEGLSINVTLLFAVSAYEEVAGAYLSGLEQRLAKGQNIKNIASVASFFVSRIDTLVDEMISKPGGSLEKAGAESTRSRLNGLLGQVAVANAYVAYAKYLETKTTARWAKLAQAGARPQRLLWASTSTKNPAYPKTKYVDALVAPETVNTIPPETVQAIIEAPALNRESFTKDWNKHLAWSGGILNDLTQVGISLKQVTDQLLHEAVKKFADPFDQLLSTLEQKAKSLQGTKS